MINQHLQDVMGISGFAQQAILPEGVSAAIPSKMVALGIAELQNFIAAFLAPEARKAF
ncbi:hypothetical protein [Scytonema sp. PRP1]|uniref:hypothetical protein n=1 Tax=Scytonema sp. PRP1 TaxID=3120513 RepID=UPI00300C4301